MPIVAAPGAREGLPLDLLVANLDTCPIAMKIDYDIRFINSHSWFAAFSFIRRGARLDLRAASGDPPQQHDVNRKRQKLSA
jgi:hypothetical protein